MGRDFTSPYTRNICPARIRGWVSWDGERKELSGAQPPKTPQQTVASEVALALSGPAQDRAQPVSRTGFVACQQDEEGYE